MGKWIVEVEQSLVWSIEVEGVDRADVVEKAEAIVEGQDISGHGPLIESRIRTRWVEEVSQ